MASTFVSPLGKLPTKHAKMLQDLSDAAQEILQELMDKRKGDPGRERDNERFKSVIDLLSELFLSYPAPVNRRFC